jgi:hypothetical protein
MKARWRSVPGLPAQIATLNGMDGTIRKFVTDTEIAARRELRDKSIGVKRD